MRFVRRRLFAVAIGAAAGLVARPALAFRPSTTWVLGRVLEKARDRGTGSLRADATTSTWDVTGKAVLEGAAERVWLEAPGRLRRELDVGKDTTVEVRSGGRLVVRQPGKPEQPLKSGLDLIADVLTASTGQEPGPAAQNLIAALKAVGVNTEVVSYARFDGRVAYLIGSKPWETDKPQVWFDKDLLVPLRLVTFQKDGSAVMRLDVRYLGWGSPVGGAWYPAAVEIWRGESLVRRTVTESLDRNITLDAGLWR
jgi:hypothetical protein